MKATGIVRKVDELGRVVLPIELRRNLDIKEKDALEIYVDEDKIILKKYEPACIFCNQSVDTVVYKGKNICANCLAELKNRWLAFLGALTYYVNAFCYTQRFCTWCGFVQFTCEKKKKYDKIKQIYKMIWEFLDFRRDDWR